MTGIGLFTTILGWTIAGSYGLSALITYINHSSSNSRIRRKGYEIKSITTNSFFENLKYLVKDFGYMILPIYNLIKSLKDMIKKDVDFDKDKISKLEDRDRLVKIKKDEPKVEEPKEQPKQQSVQQQTNNNRQTIIPARRAMLQTTPAQTTPAQTAQPKTTEFLSPEALANMTCYERRAYWGFMYDQLVAKHAEEKQKGASVEKLNSYIPVIESVIRKYEEAAREERLQTQKNIILSEPVMERTLRNDKCVL